MKRNTCWKCRLVFQIFPAFERLSSWKLTQKIDQWPLFFDLSLLLHKLDYYRRLLLIWPVGRGQTLIAILLMCNYFFVLFIDTTFVKVSSPDCWWTMDFKKWRSSFDRCLFSNFITAWMHISVATFRSNRFFHILNRRTTFSVVHFSSVVAILFLPFHLLISNVFATFRAIWPILMAILGREYRSVCGQFARRSTFFFTFFFACHTARLNIAEYVVIVEKYITVLIGDDQQSNRTVLPVDVWVLKKERAIELSPSSVRHRRHTSTHLSTHFTTISTFFL